MSAISSRGTAHSVRMRRVLAICASAGLVCGGSTAMLLTSASSASADTVGPISFESYGTGTVNAQDGWTSTGAAGGGCAVYDHQIVNNSAYPAAPASFQTKSLRVSNAVTSGCFGDQTFSKPTANAAGEPGATTGGFPTGALRSDFHASFDFASATGAPQPGLLMSVSPDRGDGARMSYVRIEDNGSTGFNVFFDDYRDKSPFGTSSNLPDGCGNPAAPAPVGDDFYETQIAAGLSYADAHSISFDMKFVPGPRNDVVKVKVDGIPVITGTSWEDYFRYCEATDTTRMVRNLLFRSGGTAVPANAGNGFLIDGIAESTTSLPSVPRKVVAYPGNGRATVSWQAPLNQGDPSLDGYIVTPVKNGVAQAPRTFNSTATKQVVTGLTNGASYKFRVVARNAIGTSAMAASTGGITVGAPGAPAKPTVTNVGPGSLRVATNPAGSNGSPVTTYTATCKSGNGGVLGSNSASKPTIKVTGLTAGKNYACRVTATNARGTGPGSAPSATATA